MSRPDRRAEAAAAISRRVPDAVVNGSYQVAVRYRAAAETLSAYVRHGRVSLERVELALQSMACAGSDWRAGLVVVEHFP